MRVDYLVGEKLPGLVHHGKLASCPQARIDTQHPNRTSRWSEQKMFDSSVAAGQGLTEACVRIAPQLASK